MDLLPARCDVKPSELALHGFRHGNADQAEDVAVELVRCVEGAGGDDEVDVGDAADEAVGFGAHGTHVEDGSGERRWEKFGWGADSVSRRRGE